MEDINRLKLLLVEKRKRVSGCLSNWVLPLQPYRSGVLTHHSQTYLL